MSDLVPLKDGSVERIAEIVGTITAKHGTTVAIEADAELSKLGMTSIDMVELMLALEAQFDLMIPAEAITADNFRSITSVDRLVGRLVAQAV